MILQKHIVKAAAWLEIATGVALIISPRLLGQLLFAAQFDGAGELVARFSGIVLLALGTACASTPATVPAPGAALGLLVYNVGAVVLFLWAGLASAFHGPLLWPVAIVHAAIAAVLLTQRLNKAMPSGRADQP